MKKADLILIVSFLVAAVAAAGIIAAFSHSGNTVTVKQDNKTVYEGPISHDTVIELEGNTVIIKDGYAVMQKAGCKNQICVSTGKIERKGETIVCLPNRVTVQIK